MHNTHISCSQVETGAVDICLLTCSCFPFSALKVKYKKKRREREKNLRTFQSFIFNISWLVHQVHVCVPLDTPYLLAWLCMFVFMYIVHVFSCVCGFSSTRWNLYIEGKKKSIESFLVSFCNALLLTAGCYKLLSWQQSIFSDWLRSKFFVLSWCWLFHAVLYVYIFLPRVFLVFFFRRR